MQFYMVTSYLVQIKVGIFDIDLWPYLKWWQRMVLVLP